MPIFGNQHLNLDSNLRRIFTWSFVFVKVIQLTIGIDSLKRFNLLVDAKNNRIMDSERVLSSLGKVAHILPDSSVVNALLSSSKSDGISADYH